MLLSIIIPVYNVEQFIEECLDSVCTQSFADWEAICVNDGSTDCSLSLLQEFASRDSRIHVVSQSNAGLSAARNTGLKAASGEYILFLDSDDWLENNALERLASQLNGEDMVCFTGRRYFEDNGQYEEPDVLSEQTYESGWDYFCHDVLLPRSFPFVCVVLRAYKRTFLIDYNLWFAYGIYHEDDMFTPYACFYAGKTVVVNECLYVYRIRKGSISYQPKLKNLQDKLWVASQQANFFKHQSKDKLIVYRLITHVFHSVFDNLTPQNCQILYKSIDWKGYYTVSRTKLRHRVYFAAMCVSYKLYLYIRRRFS